MNRFCKLTTRAGRPAELVLAVVFLSGALLKALDINLFTVQIRAYGLFRDPSFLAVAALSTLAIETFLGAALLFRIRVRGWTYAVVSALLVVFTFLISYGWLVSDLEDCGCFGPIEMSPQVSIAKNILLLLLAAAAWLGLRFGQFAEASPLTRGRARIAMCAFLATVIVLYAFSQMEPVVKATEDSRPFAQFVFDLDGVHYDLGKGEYFVAMLDAACEHCMATVEDLNQRLILPDFPPIIGLCYEQETGLLDEFRDATGALFPLYSLGDRVRLFFSLVGEAPPRFIYVYEGRQIVYWDLEVPDATLVALARTAAGAKAS